MILFLDIDGVLAPIPRPLGQDKFALSCVNNLAKVFQVCPETNIVISSTWRIGKSVRELRELLENRGLRFADRIIDKTLDFTETGILEYLTRGQEISDWLINHKEIVNYCVVDDDTDIAPHWPKWVRPISSQGFSDENARQCIEIFRNVK